MQLCCRAAHFPVVQKEKMQILIIIMIRLIVIIAATVIGKRLPPAAVFKTIHFFI